EKDCHRADLPISRGRNPHAMMRSFLSLLVCGFLFVFTSVPAGAASQTSVGELNDAEKWVVAQVSAGKTADLDAALNADQTKKFPEEKDRKLSAHFLEELLTGALPGVKLHRHGVRIVWAVIDEP